MTQEKIHQPGNKEALALWYTVILQGVRSDAPDLSARQLAIMMTVYIDPKQYTIKALSQRLAISKPAVSRAIDALEKLEFVRRAQDVKDRRIVFITRTPKGYEFLGQFSDKILNNLAAIQ